MKTSNGKYGQRLGSYFKSMKNTCPTELAAYGACVAAHANSPLGIEKGCCETEFQAMKQCFRQVRGPIGRR